MKTLSSLYSRLALLMYAMVFVRTKVAKSLPKRKKTCYNIAPTEETRLIRSTSVAKNSHIVRLCPTLQVGCCNCFLSRVCKVIAHLSLYLCINKIQELWHTDIMQILPLLLILFLLINTKPLSQYSSTRSVLWLFPKYRTNGCLLSKHLQGNLLRRK